MSAAFHVFAERLEQSLKLRYEQCNDVATPSSILLAVLNAVADARSMAPINPAPLGLMLREARERSSLSLADVAEAAHLSKSYLWELETGSQLNPTLGAMRRLSAVLAIKPEDWFR